jgi:hypothetical protein
LAEDDVEIVDTVVSIDETAFSVFSVFPSLLESVESAESENPTTNSTSFFLSERRGFTLRIFKGLTLPVDLGCSPTQQFIFLLCKLFC